MRDYHYFGMSCQTCRCFVEGTPEDPGALTKDGECKAEGGGQTTRPDLSGVCTCPSGKPLCVTRARAGMQETIGCILPAVLGGVRHANQYAADCVECACREPCPQHSRNLFADSYGECRCSDATPECYQGGAKGCIATSRVDGLSSTYFKSSCGDDCECRDALGRCDAKTCLTSADCVYDVCQDCQMCLGISRCAQDGVKSEVLDINGNCHCATELSCFLPGAELPSCPIAPFGDSTTAFRGNCRGCQCKKLTSDVQIVGLQCPTFARDVKPDRHGDCACPNDAPDCYQDGVIWCGRNDNRRDLHYFSVGCSNCECRPAVEEIEVDRQKPCPSFARNELSDVQGNCACPLEKPLCIEGVWPITLTSTVAPAGTSASLLSRPGPLCNTTYGWLSSTTFRYDCGEDCRCIEVEGEGSRLRKIQPDELLVLPEGSYMHHYMFLDIRVINSLDSIQDWTEAENDFTMDAFASFEHGIAGGLNEILPAAAVVKNLSIVSRQDFVDAIKETVRAMRLRIDFGVMWTEGRRLQSPFKLRTSHVSVRQLQNATLKAKLKKVDDLTARETNLLLNFASVFNDLDFKVEFETDINRFLNETWENRTGNATDDPVAPSKEMMAPHIEATRVVLDGPALAALGLLGPIELDQPVLRNMDRKVVVKEEGGLPVALIGIGVGGLVGLLCVSVLCLSLCRRCKKRYKKRQHAKKLERSGTGGDTSATGGSGSPRSPNSGSPDGSPRGMFGLPGGIMGKKGGKTSKKGAHQLQHLHQTMYQRASKGEIRNSMMLGGGNSHHQSADGSPRSETGDGSPRTRARAKAKAIHAQATETEEKKRERKRMMKKLGDLNGLKSLSQPARDALQAEYNLKFGSKKDRKKISESQSDGEGKDGKRKSKRQSQGSADGGSPNKTPGGSPDASPDPSLDGSPRGEDEPTSPTSNKSPAQVEKEKEAERPRKIAEMRNKMGQAK